MIVGLGMDLVEVERIQKSVARHGARFLDRCFTAQEQAYCTSRGVQRDESLAARFAAKEACWKALGVPPGLRFTDMEVMPAASGRPPCIKFSRVALDAASHLGVVQSLVTMTHASGMAAATVVLEARP